MFLMDPSWNSATDEQAMDRCHRLEQTKKVSVVRYIISESIEEKVLQLQKRNAAINKWSMVKLSREELQQARVAEVVMLFEL